MLKICIFKFHNFLKGSVTNSSNKIFTINLQTYFLSFANLEFLLDNIFFKSHKFDFGNL